MTAYLAILRGVNVSGHNRVKMADLERVFQGLGHSRVATFIQSGNVIFTSSDASSTELVRGIEQALAVELGLNVSALLRSRREMERVIQESPFLETGRDLTKLHVTFLAEEPTRSLGDDFDQQSFRPDKYWLGTREVYLHCPLGYGRTRLNNSFWERRLGISATSRNWNSVTRLTELLRELA